MEISIIFEYFREIKFRTPLRKIALGITLQILRLSELKSRSSEILEDSITFRQNQPETIREKSSGEIQAENKEIQAENMGIHTENIHLNENFQLNWD